MGSEDAPQVLMAALRDEVGVHLAQGGQVAVGVVAQRRVLTVGDGHAVGGNLLAGQSRNPNAAALVGRRVGSGWGNHVDRVGEARDDADRHARVAQVSAEHGVRRIVGA